MLRILAIPGLHLGLVSLPFQRTLVLQLRSLSIDDTLHEGASIGNQIDLFIVWVNDVTGKVCRKLQ
jgi:hypothetical protein